VLVLEWNSPGTARIEGVATPAPVEAERRDERRRWAKSSRSRAQPRGAVLEADLILASRS
jgi:hypothetical protein